MFDIEQLKARILELAFQYKLSHLGSSLTALPIICEIYEKKNPDDIFILSSGHAGLALYVVLEQVYEISAEELLKQHGVHPSRNIVDHIYCSTGSLGIGVTIGIGAAFASPKKQIYILCSDGETAEGSFWESLRVLHKEKLNNCHLYVNINGFSAYSKLDVLLLEYRIRAFLDFNLHIRKTIVEQYSFLKGLDAHYYVMNKEDYMSCQK
jgi:transketolase N-terminal domain/subunit